MVTTTTKTIEYVIDKKNSINRVHATLTSTSGFNSFYVKKIQGILKILQLALTATALGLIGSRTNVVRPHLFDDVRGNELAPRSYARQATLVGDVYFLCAHTAVITVLTVFLITYLFSIISAMVISKVSIMNMVSNIILSLLLLSAGILEIVQVETSVRHPDTGNLLMGTNEEAIRLSAGVIALLNGLLFLVSFALARRDLTPKTPQATNEQTPKKLKKPEERQNL